MPTAILRIDLANGIHSLRMPRGYDHALILVTYKGTPIGDLRLGTAGRLIGVGCLRRKIAEEYSYDTLRLWLADQLRPIQDRSEWPQVDIVVCTSDRPADLEKCLSSLSEVDYPNKRIVVVDNGTDPDETHSVAKRHETAYVREIRRGLDFARNAGITHSDAPIVVFTDDDVAVDTNWVRAIVEAFESDSSISCVTGLTMPMELETEAQEFFEQYSDGGMRRGYRRVVFDRLNLAPTSAGKVGVGANMAFRTSVFRHVGLFDEALDCGTPAKAGGDTDMFYRLLRNGYRICYEPRALVWHRHRRSMEELHRQISGYSLAIYAFLFKCLIEYRDPSALASGLAWFRNHHLRNLWRHLTLRGNAPWSLVAGEIAGVISGPGAYLRSREYAKRQNELLQCENQDVRQLSDEPGVVPETDQLLMAVREVGGTDV